MLTRWAPPVSAQVRVDSHCYPGYVVPPDYDSLLAKLIVSGADRAGAINTLDRALARFVVDGVPTTIDFHRAVVRHPAFRENRLRTRWVETDFMPRWAVSGSN